MRWLPQMHSPQSIHVPEQSIDLDTHAHKKTEQCLAFRSPHSVASLLQLKPAKKCNQMEEKNKYPELVSQSGERRNVDRKRANRIAFEL